MSQHSATISPSKKPNKGVFDGDVIPPPTLISPFHREDPIDTLSPTDELHSMLISTHEYYEANAPPTTTDISPTNNAPSTAPTASAADTTDPAVMEMSHVVASGTAQDLFGDSSTDITNFLLPKSSAPPRIHMSSSLLPPTATGLGADQQAMADGNICNADGDGVILFGVNGDGKRVHVVEAAVSPSPMATTTRDRQNEDELNSFVAATVAATATTSYASRDVTDSQEKDNDGEDILSSLATSSPAACVPVPPLPPNFSGGASVSAANMNSATPMDVKSMLGSEALLHEAAAKPALNADVFETSPTSIMVAEQLSPQAAPSWPLKRAAVEGVKETVGVGGVGGRAGGRVKKKGVASSTGIATPSSKCRRTTVAGKPRKRTFKRSRKQGCGSKEGATAPCPSPATLQPQLSTLQGDKDVQVKCQYCKNASASGSASSGSVTCFTCDAGRLGKTYGTVMGNVVENETNVTAVFDTVIARANLEAEESKKMERTRLRSEPGGPGQPNQRASRMEAKLSRFKKEAFIEELQKALREMVRNANVYRTVAMAYAPGGVMGDISMGVGAGGRQGGAKVGAKKRGGSGDTKGR